MSTASVSSPWDRVTKRRLMCFAGIHALLDYLLLTQAWIPFGDYLFLFMLALPVAQCSLVAIWASLSKAHLIVRFAAPVAAAAGTWMVMMGMLSWGGNDGAAPGWAIVFGTQTVALVLTLHLVRHRYGSQKQGEALRSPFVFDLRTMMLWITTIGLTFGFVQYGRVHWNWTAAISEWEYFDAMPLIGLLNASIALLWFWVFSSRGLLSGIAKLLLTTAMIVGMCVASAHLLNWLLAAGTSIELEELIMLAVGQSLSLVVTMAGLRILPSPLPDDTRVLKSKTASNEALSQSNEALPQGGARQEDALSVDC